MSSLNAFRASPTSLTTLLLNGRVHSPAMPDATAMAVRDGVIGWLGSDDVGRDQFPDAEVVDLDGGFVAPRSSTATYTSPPPASALPGSTCVRPRRCGTALRSSVSTHTPTATARSGDTAGTNPVGRSAPRPAPTTIDDVLGDRPAYLARVDVHSAAASTALRRLSPGLAGAAGFDAQGPVTGDAHHLVRAAARDRLTPQQRQQARIAALDFAAASGIVAVHECAGPDIGGLDDWRALRDTRPRRRGRRLLG